MLLLLIPVKLVIILGAQGLVDFAHFFPMGDSVPKMIYSIQTILIYNNTKTFFLVNDHQYHKEVIRRGYT